MVPQATLYTGELRCRVTHSPSNVELTTDAPTDNHGRGESFSPTDLVVTALGSCMITTMGIAVERDGIQLQGTTIHSEKHMSTSAPRKIARIVLQLDFPAGIPHAVRPRLQHIADTCPVRLSIHPDIKIDCTLNYPD